MGNAQAQAHEPEPEPEDESTIRGVRAEGGKPVVGRSNIIRLLNSRAVGCRPVLDDALEKLALVRGKRSEFSLVHKSSLNDVLLLRSVARTAGKLSRNSGENLASLARSLSDTDDPNLNRKTVSFIRLGGLYAALDALFVVRARLAFLRASPTNQRGPGPGELEMASHMAGNLLMVMRECAYSVHSVARPPCGPLSSIHVIALALSFTRWPLIVDPARYALEELFACGVPPPSLSALRWHGVDVLHILSSLSPGDLMQLTPILAGLCFHGEHQEPISRVQSARVLLSQCRASATHHAETAALRLLANDDSTVSIVAKEADDPVACAAPDRESSLMLPTLRDGCMPVKYIPSLGRDLDENIEDILFAGNGVLLFRLLQLATLPAPTGHLAEVLGRFGHAGQVDLQELFEFVGGHGVEEHGHDGHGHAHGVAVDEADGDLSEGDGDSESDAEEDEAEDEDGDEQAAAQGMFDLLLGGGAMANVAAAVASPSDAQFDSDDEVLPELEGASSAPLDRISAGAAAAPIPARGVDTLRSELTLLVMAHLKVIPASGNAVTQSPVRGVLSTHVAALRRGSTTTTEPPSSLAESTPSPALDDCFDALGSLELTLSTGRGVVGSAELRCPGPLSAPPYLHALPSLVDPQIPSGGDSTIVTPARVLLQRAVRRVIGNEGVVPAEDDLARGVFVDSVDSGDALSLLELQQHDGEPTADVPKGIFADAPIHANVKCDWDLVSQLAGPGSSRCSAAAFVGAANGQFGVTAAGAVRRQSLTSGVQTSQPRFAWSHYALPRNCYDVVPRRSFYVIGGSLAIPNEAAVDPRDIDPLLPEMKLPIASLDTTTVSTEKSSSSPSRPATSIFQESDCAASGADIRGATRHTVTFSGSNGRNGAGSHTNETQPLMPGRPARDLGDLGLITENNARVALLMHTLSASQSSAVFLVSALLGGSRRRQMQDFIAGCGFLPGFMRLLARTDWLYDPGSSPLPRIHGPTCECRPETANLVPLLRALHALIDRECESPIQKWLSRRRLMTHKELISAYGSFGSPGAVLCSSDGRRFVDESALLMESVRPAATRPGAISPSTGNQPWRVLGMSAPEACVFESTLLHPQRHLVLVDPVLCGRNAAFVKPLDVHEIDSDDEFDAPGQRSQILSARVALPFDSMSSALSFAPSVRPELSCDATCEELFAAAAVKRGSQVNVAERALRKALRVLVAKGAAIAPQLEEKRPRGIISMLTAMLAVLPPNSPFRGWFCSIVNSFLRAAPLPVRKWLAAHGIVPVMASFLINAATVLLAKKSTSASIPVITASTSATEDGGDACKSGEEDSPAYDRQACFDVLSECVRCDIAAIDELWNSDFKASAAIVPLQPSVAKATDNPINVLLQSSLLLGLACDFLSDSNMFLRALFSCEDWSYGLVGVLPSLGVSFSHVEVGGVRAELNDDVNSWERLAGESIEMLRGSFGLPITPLPTSPLYEHIDRVALARPLLKFVRLFRIPLLYALMSAVTVDNICHDNICNVNTALLVVVAAHRHGALPALIRRLREHHALVLSASAIGSADVTSAQLMRLPSLSQRADLEASATIPASKPAPPDIFLNFVLSLLFWLEYNSLRERDRRALRSMTQYQYAECRVVVRALLGLPVTRARTGPLVALSALSEPPQSFYGIRQYVLEQAGRGSSADSHIAAAGSASAERLRKACAEFDAFSAQALEDSTQPAEGWLQAPPRLVAAMAPATNTRVQEGYWKACSLLPLQNN